MMSVTEVACRRFRQCPLRWTGLSPRRCQHCSFDLNNNAKSEKKRPKIINLQRLIACIKDHKAKKSPRHFLQVAIKKVKLKTDPKPKPIMCDHSSAFIGANEIIVNHAVLQDENSKANKDTVLYFDGRLTPPDYSNSAHFYHDVTKARQTYLRAAILIGDLLQNSNIEGDVTDWENYVTKRENDVKEWEKKCQQSLDNREMEKRYWEEDYYANKYEQRIRIFIRRTKESWNKIIDSFRECFTGCYW